MTKLQPGDRVAYAAAFLRNTGQFTGGAAARRGTFLRPFPGMEKTHAYVRWDDEEEYISRKEGCYTEEDYCEEVRRNGRLIAIKAIAKVGGARFALNDM